jgi:histidinol dehydrogenase
MQIERLSADQVAQLGGPAGAAARVRSLVPDGDSVAEQVRKILAAVCSGGDAAVLDYTRRFDTHGNQPQSLLVPGEELDEAIKQLPLELIAGLQVAIVNVALVADAGVGTDTAVDLPQGQRIVLREVPVGSAAVYVPGGRAAYPSTVVMGVVTARSAGVVDVAVCAPPGPDGQIDPVILGTCRLCGVERVYCMGGAQAIAALAYGTDTVDRVDVIVGPGNLYVQEAKHQLSAIVGIDGFAGPSDLLVALGAQAGAHELQLAALDMLAQAEHGEGSLVAAVSPSEAVCDALAEK